MQSLLYYENYNIFIALLNKDINVKLVIKLFIVAPLLFPISVSSQILSDAPPLPKDVPTSSEPSKAKSQIEFYASEYGVSAAEALRRMKVIRKAGILADKLYSSSIEDFGGIEIIHKPEFTVVIRFTGDADAKVKALGLGQGYIGVPAVESWQLSKVRQKAVGDTLRKAGVVYQSTLKPDGTLDVFVANKDVATIFSLLNDAGVDRLDRVKIVTSVDTGNARLCVAPNPAPEPTTLFPAKAGVQWCPAPSRPRPPPSRGNNSG